MGVSAARLQHFLARHRRIGLDTPPFIYQIQGHPKYIPFSEEIFDALGRPGLTAVTSVLTMLEVLVQPYRISDRERVNRIYALLYSYPGLQWMEANLEIADLGARLRARHNLRTPDALQAATAIHARATGFVTNDAAFRRVSELDVLLLDDLLG